MGYRGIPLTLFFLSLTLSLTLGQYTRSRGYHSFFGTSEAPCGPYVQSRSSWSSFPSRPSRPSRTSLNYPQGFSPYQAALLDIDIPPFYYSNAFGSPRQPQTPYYGGNRMSYPVSSYPPRATRRRAKRRAMLPGMNCQCDSAADCNMFATMWGASYNSQCRRGLVCCCRSM